MVRNEEVIRVILDNGDTSEGKDVLDVAIGTGVLNPDYPERRVRSVTAIEISPKMAEIARAKFRERISLIRNDSSENSQRISLRAVICQSHTG